MENRKTVRISDEQIKIVEFFRKKFKCSENSIFLIALENLYKEYNK